jgi:hypothetical protein
MTPSMTILFRTERTHRWILQVVVVSGISARMSEVARKLSCSDCSENFLYYPDVYSGDLFSVVNGIEPSLGLSSLCFDSTFKVQENGKRATARKGSQGGWTLPASQLVHAEELV